MKAKHQKHKAKPAGTAGKAANRGLSADLNPPRKHPVKELVDATMSGIIPGRLHLCRAYVRFISAEQV